MEKKSRRRGPDPGLKRLRLWLSEVHGRGSRLASYLGTTRASVYNWKRIPRDQIRSIHEFTVSVRDPIPLEELAPDLYREDTR